MKRLWVNAVALRQRPTVHSSVRVRKLLLVGPKPPPIGGSPLTVQAMLAELASYASIRVRVINTSPRMDVKRQMTGFNLEKVARSLIILPEYVSKIHDCDVVLVFANDLFAITLAPILWFLARILHKPFFLKPVAASLDLFIKAQKPLLRGYLLGFLQATDGVLAQTRLLREDLRKMGCTNVHYLPGCRPLSPLATTRRVRSAQCRIIFLGHINRRKGPLVLLDALNILEVICSQDVVCDFYGPIHDEIRGEFMHKVVSTPNAHYCGVAEPGSGPQLIAKYDVLVLPTYYETEGHPGVLIEAMQAGVPVIGTQVRTFPELIANGMNGLLVPTKDSLALAQAISELAMDPTLRRRMGEANYRRGQEFRADVVVAQMLRILFPGLPIERSPVETGAPI